MENEFYSCPRGLSVLQVGTVDLPVRAVVRHYFENVTFRFRKADLGREDANVSALCALEPARDVVFAAVIRSNYPLRQIGEKPFELGQVFTPDGNRDFRPVQ